MILCSFLKRMFRKEFLFFRKDWYNMDIDFKEREQEDIIGVNEQLFVFGVLALTTALLIWGRIRSDLVAIGMLLVLMLTGILTPAEALGGFSNPVVIMMIGLFVVGAGIFRTGLAAMVGRTLLKWTSSGETRLLFIVMSATTALGIFLSNTGTVAVLMPVVVSMAMAVGISPSRLLMPMAFASSFGGTMTLIGTPPNLVISETLADFGYPELSLFSFTPIGIIVTLSGFLFLLTVGRRLLPRTAAEENGGTEGRSPRELALDYQLAGRLYRAEVTERSPLLNRPLADKVIPDDYDVMVLEIRRKSSSKNPFFKTLSHEWAGPDTVIQKNDILYLHGSYEQVRRLAAELHLRLLDHLVAEQVSTFDLEKLVSPDIGIAEVLLTPNSSLINRRIKECQFREKYRLNILGIYRKGTYILTNLKDQAMRFGDALLVQGAWEDIARLAKETYDVVVVGQPLEVAEKLPLDEKAPLAAGILLFMLVLLTWEIVPAVVAVMLAAVLMVLGGCLRSMEEAYRSISWESVVFIGGMIPLSTALEKTGAAQTVSETMIAVLGEWGPMALLTGIYVLVSVLTLFISNTATAVLFAPIAATTALAMELSPYPFLFAVAIGASMAFATPVATPTNMLVVPAGGYRFIDFVKVGLPLQLFVGTAVVLALPLLFPF